MDAALEPQGLPVVGRRPLHDLVELYRELDEPHGVIFHPGALARQDHVHGADGLHLRGQKEWVYYCIRYGGASGRASPSMGEAYLVAIEHLDDAVEIRKDSV